MANHKSAKKRAKQSEKRRVHNKSRRSEVRTYIKALRTAIAGNEKSKAQELLVLVQSKLAKLGKTNTLNRLTAARKTSRLAQQVAKI